MHRRVMFAALVIAFIPASLKAVTINFDDITAPPAFINTSPLTTAYSFLGVTFSGPSPGTGGAILNQQSSFGVNAQSGVNFLAFNRTAAYSNGNLATDPETLTFSTPINTFSIFASGGGQSNSFQAQAFLGATPVTSATGSNTAASYVLLSLSASSFNRVVLSGTGADTAFVFDTLNFTLVPEPVSLPVLGLLTIAVRCRRA